jgi:cytochrome c5
MVSFKYIIYNTNSSNVFFSIASYIPMDGGKEKWKKNYKKGKEKLYTTLDE